MELLVTLEAEKLTKEKCKQYCGTPSITVFNIITTDNIISFSTCIFFRVFSREECSQEEPRTNWVSLGTTLRYCQAVLLYREDYHSLGGLLS